MCLSQLGIRPLAMMCCCRHKEREAEEIEVLEFLWAEGVDVNHMDKVRLLKEHVFVVGNRSLFLFMLCG